ncbi:MAG: hypothetical protein GXZ00_02000, partial [Synergistaceae bacterium]|nr:hypothetical protein [Synergistaceae bacterium]
MIKFLILVILLTAVPGDFHMMGAQTAEAAIQPPAASRTAKEENRMSIDFKDNTYVKENGTGVIYLAGGCFWGLEKL